MGGKHNERQGRPGFNGNQPASELRMMAEEQLRRLERELPAFDTSSMARRDVDDLIHELRVHEIELEMQNEELQLSQLLADAARARYFALYDLAPIGYLSLNSDGGIAEANQQACALFRVDKAELLGQKLDSFVVADDQDAYYGLQRRLMAATQAVHECELRLQTRGQSPLWVRISAASSVDDSSGVRTTRMALSDTSEIRILQAELKQADRMANMGVLAAGVAHEINNPLTYVLLNSEDLALRLANLAAIVDRLAEILPPDIIASLGPGHEMLLPGGLAELCLRAQQTVEGTRRISDIARGLSNFSHRERGEPGEVNINAAIRSALAMAQNELRFRARTITELSDIPPIIAADGEVTQVFVNLLVNAAHAIDEGDVDNNHIRLRTWTDNGQVFAEVQDTGCGIAEADRQRIFEPFFTTKQLGRGTGLGLSISRRIVRALGGDIELDISVRNGTRFVLRFPVACTPAGEQAQPAALVPIRARVLLVDDDPVVRAALTKTLAELHQVDGVGSARQAMDLLDGGRDFHVILCDLMMPGTDGVDLHRWVTESHPKLADRFIFITGGAFTRKTSDYLSAVSNLCLRKPVSAEMLLQAIADRVRVAEQAS